MQAVLCKQNSQANLTRARFVLSGELNERNACKLFTSWIDIVFKSAQCIRETLKKLEVKNITMFLIMFLFLKPRNLSTSLEIIVCVVRFCESFLRVLRNQLH